MVVIGTKRLAVINIETLVWERLLSSAVSAIKVGTSNQLDTDMTDVTIEALFMIFALELAIRRRHGLLLNWQLTTAALQEPVR